MTNSALWRLVTLGRDRRALGAVEFAMTAPFLILLYLGGFQMMDAISTYRKVVIADRALADLTTQDTVMTPTEAQSIITGAEQIMTPYSSQNATFIITQVAFDANGVPSVDWTQSNDGTVVKTANLQIPSKIAVANTYVILSQIIYRYQPIAGAKLIGPLTFTDHIFMNPRRSNSIPMETS